jgi:hypothetical protein
VAGILSVCEVEFVQDATGGRYVQWPANVVGEGSIYPQPDPAALARTKVRLTSADGGGTWVASCPGVWPGVDPTIVPGVTNAYLPYRLGGVPSVRCFPGFTLDAGGGLARTPHGVSGHALTLTLSGAAPGAAAATASGAGHLPRLEVRIEAGWRDDLELQLLEMASGAAASALPLASLAGHALRAEACPEDASVDVSLCVAAAASAPREPSSSLLLLLRTPQSLDLTLHASASVEVAVRLSGKLEGDCAVEVGERGLPVAAAGQVPARSPQRFTSISLSPDLASSK